MKIFKGFLALLYAMFNVAIIDGTAILAVYLAVKIMDWNWYYILLLWLFGVGIFEGICALLLTLIMLPYAWMLKNNSNASILPMIYISVRCIWYIVSYWIDYGSINPWWVGVIMTYIIIRCIYIFISSILSLTGNRM